MGNNTYERNREAKTSQREKIKLQQRLQQIPWELGSSLALQSCAQVRKRGLVFLPPHQPAMVSGLHQEKRYQISRSL
jgi:hypothetical protein